MNKRDYELEDLTKEEVKELEKKFPDLKHEKEMRAAARKLDEFNEEKHEEAVRKFFAEKEAEEKNCEL